MVDLHNHTHLCNHATGTPLEYAKKAYENGIKIYGFSDHNPMNFDEKYRMSFSQIEIYENMIKETKAEFKGKMEILLGYEVDFLENFMPEIILNRKVDYLIGSVHFLDGWGFDNPEFIGGWENREIDEIYKEYFEKITLLCKSGKFQILGHFDLIKVFKFLPKKDVRVLAKNALKAIKESGIVVELNSAGLRKPVCEIYPSDILLEEIANLGVNITLSSDAHSVEQVTQNYEKLLEKAKFFGYSKVVYFRQKDIEFMNL
ncbi:MAG: histidinol-phosphatase [Campylobacter sp.]|nr:histidinol-phosphatase [Campylobacter sp.]